MAGLFRLLKGLMKAGSNEPLIPEFKDEPGKGYRGPTPAKAAAKAPAVIDPSLQIVAPVDGIVVALHQVPDSTIAKNHLGSGMAVDATNGRVVSPVPGQIHFPFATNHAFVVSTESGIDVLIHIGIGSVELLAGTFRPLVAEGEQVMAGQPVVEFDHAQVRAEVSSLATCVLVQNMHEHDLAMRLNAQGLHIFAGDDLFCLEVRELS